MRLGIDFGTTNSVVAAVMDGNHPVVGFNVNGDIKDYIPSLAVVWHDQIHYGWDAYHRLDQPGAVLIRSIKRLMGEMGPHQRLEPVSGFSISLEDLIVGFLSHVRRMILEQSSLELSPHEPLEVLAATPANAGGNQRYLTLEAFNQAGFHLLGAMNEPSAAAVEYAHRYLKNLGPKSPKAYIIVYDLGGGTFDTSVVGLAGRHFDILAHHGIARLGGDDFDRIMLDLVREKRDQPFPHLDQGQINRLLEECRERKEAIKTNTRKVVVDLSPAFGRDEEVVLATADLFDRCTPLIAETVACLQSLLPALSNQGIDTDDIRTLAAVYLVGGSAAFPPVARFLREAYPSKVKVSPYPCASTAIGLALSADPDQNIKVRESISRHFGVWREHEHGREKVFDPIISKNQQVNPDSGIFEVVRIYRPTHDIGHLRYLECTDLGPNNEPAGDITLWPEIFFPYDPDLSGLDNLAGRPVCSRPDLAHQEIRETYTYDASGIIRVCIENGTAHYRKNYILK